MWSAPHVSWLSDLVGYRKELQICLHRQPLRCLELVQKKLLMNTSPLLLTSHSEIQFNLQILSALFSSRTNAMLLPSKHITTAPNFSGSLSPLLRKYLTARCNIHFHLLHTGMPSLRTPGSQVFALVIMAFGGDRPGKSLLDLLHSWLGGNPKRVWYPSSMGVVKWLG